jgi:hypothetical protein
MVGNATIASRKTLASHRPVILMEVSRYHHERRGIDFDAAIPSLMPVRYAFAELRSGGIVKIENLAQCTDTDVLAIPEERLHEIDQRQWRDRLLGRERCRLLFP